MSTTLAAFFDTATSLAPPTTFDGVVKVFDVSLAAVVGKRARGLS